MSTALAISALLMGLAGGPHCAAMCGPACGALVRHGASPARALWAFQVGRLAGYAVAGAAAAAAVQSFAWLTTHTAALRPLWTLFHLAVLAWGLMLIAKARQPVWVSEVGRTVWSRVRSVSAAPGGVFGAGALWAFMPCGLLYSALLVASLSGNVVNGALSMALFALGSGLSLSLAPMLFGRVREGWGTRAAGALLVAAALWALWMDMAERIALWCGLG